MTSFRARLPFALAAMTLTAMTTLAALPAAAQGTDEQREACAPDAIKLCSDVIPDVPKTTACMKRHHAQLSSRCRVVFDASTAPGEATSRGRTATREADVPAGPADEPMQAVGAAPERMPGLHAYEAHIRQICRQGLVDAFTCRNTLDLLKAGE